MSVIKIIATLLSGWKISCNQTPVFKKPPTSWRSKDKSGPKAQFFTGNNHYIPIIFVYIEAETASVGIHVRFILILIFFNFMWSVISRLNNSCEDLLGCISSQVWDLHLSEIFLLNKAWLIAVTIAVWPNCSSISLDVSALWGHLPVSITSGAVWGLRFLGLRVVLG